jgi:hypothetical protein
MLHHFLRASRPPIQFIGFSTAGVSTSSINIPTGTQPGDLVIVATFIDGFPSAPNTPTGYTLGQSSGSLDVDYMWAYKIMPNPVDTTASGLTPENEGGHIAITFRNVDQTTPLDVAAPTRATNNSGMPQAPAVTTINPGAVVILGFLDDDLVNNTTAPSNWTLAVNNTIGSSGAGGTLMGAYRITDSGGTYTPAAFGGSGTDLWVATTIPLRRA